MPYKTRAINVTNGTLKHLKLLIYLSTTAHAPTDIELLERVDSRENKN